mgnify:FL=1
MYPGKENEILNEFLDTFKNADYKYENDQRKRGFWKASLKVHNDPGKGRSAKKISNWILSGFTKKNVIYYSRIMQ